MKGIYLENTKFNTKIKSYNEDDFILDLVTKPPQVIIS